MRNYDNLVEYSRKLDNQDPSFPPSTLHFYKSKLIIKVNLKFQAQELLELPKFKTALEYRDTFTFGIDKLDSKLQLHTDEQTLTIYTRLKDASKLPRKTLKSANKFKDGKNGVSKYCQRCLEMANYLYKPTNTIYSKNENDKVRKMVIICKILHLKI